MPKKKKKGGRYLLPLIILLLTVGLAIGAVHKEDQEFKGGLSTGVRTHTADVTLNQDDCGKVHLVGTAGVDITLPPHRDGCEIVVVLTTAFTTTNITIKAAPADLDTITGSIITNAGGTLVACSATDQLNLVNNAENVGDFARVISTGSVWRIVHAHAFATGGITCTG